MHILLPETDNCPSWISGRERMTVENISWSISTTECCRPRRGSNPRPPGLQSDAHPTAPPRPALHCAWSLITRFLLWGPLGGRLCRWPCYHRWIAWGMCQETLDLERSNGEERTESKCRKDKDHDLRYGTGPPAEFRRVSMCRLSHCGQQQHLL